MDDERRATPGDVVEGLVCFHCERRFKVGDQLFEALDGMKESLPVYVQICGSCKLASSMETWPDGEEAQETLDQD